MCCGQKSMILLVPLAILYPIYLFIFLIIMVLRLTFSMLYFLLWKVLAVIVPPIKNIENKKKEYQEAKKVLNLICTQMGSSNNGYSEPLFEAIRQGTYEVVDEILFTSPATINCKDEEGFNVIQSAIINRSEKVYNLIYHIIEHTESYRKITDFLTIILYTWLEDWPLHLYSLASLVQHCNYQR
ncbi:putative ankyrin repeat-containing domain superfamily [Helianthus annuus]|nr:putative ankyrin repeat-containing domain superfamily [Helianthus annuus]